MTQSRRNPVVFGLVAIGFWLTEAALHVTVLGDGNLARSILRPDAHELYTRVLFLATMALAGVIWYRSVSRFDRAHRELALDESNYRAVVEASPDCVLVHTYGEPQFANELALKTLGVQDIAELRRHSIYDFIDPEDHAVVRERMQQIMASDERQHPIELRVRRPGGAYATMLATSAPVRYAGQAGILTYFRDITAEVETRRDLIASRERLSLALEAAQDGVWDWDIPSGRMVYSRSWATMLGLELQNVTPDHSTWRALVHPDDRGRAMSLLEAHLRGDVPAYETEVRLHHARGHYIWVLDRGKVVERDSDGRALRMTGTHRDITDRKEAELALEVRNRLAETFLTGSGPEIYGGILDLVREATDSPSGLLGTLDADNNLRIVAGYPTPASTRAVIRSGDLSPRLREAISQERAFIVADEIVLDGCDHRGQGGLIVPISTRETVLGVLVVAERADGYGPTDRAFVESLAGYLAPILHSHLTNEVTEAQLRQAQKMEALGALAGGIAHDFNNILQAVLGFTTLARDDAEEGSTLAGDLDRVLKATRRGEELVRRILLFSRREEQEVAPVSVTSMVQEAVDLLTPTLPATIRLEADLEPDAGIVVADPSQISQVVLNLATNSFHAMEDGGGVLTIAVRRRAAAEAEPAVPPGLIGRDLAVITVRDTGCGMDRPTLARLFDPFFTTKDVGKGTGLGLSVVHGIVTGHGGDIRIESAPGQGTEINVFLPLMTGAVVPPGAAAPAPAGHILFVDDELAIGELARTMLERHGYAVTVCVGGRAALEFLAQESLPFDLLVTDLVMPEVAGPEVVAAAAARHPDLPVLVVSGRREAFSEDPGEEGRVAGIINKPFSGESLRRAVERALRLVPGAER